MVKFLEREQDSWHLLTSTIFFVLSVSLSYALYTSGVKLDKISLLDLSILVLASFRMIRLLTYDSVTSFLRDYFDQFEKGPKRTLSDLLHCPWCTGIWMALGVVYAYFFIPGSIFFFFILAIAGASSYLQIIIKRVSLALNQKNTE